MRAINTEDWRTTVGARSRFFDWRALFRKALAGGDWTRVVRLWVPGLAPGLAGVATHGIIRTGHAVRARGQHDNEVRRLELATALAYRASRHEEGLWDGSGAASPSVEATLPVGRVAATGGPSLPR